VAIPTLTITSNPFIYYPGNGNMMKHQGFTLFELLITLLIMSLIMGLAIPGLFNQIQKSRTQTATQSLLQAIETARTAAVMQNKRTVLISKEKWHKGWKLFVDLDNDGVEDPDEPVIHESGKLEGIKITGNNPVKKYISFIATGEGRKAGKANSGAFITGTLTVCPENKGSGYKLVLSRGGRLRSQAINEADCAKNA
jgi:type IV fimbrial biogenesis protein FimT